MKKVLITGASGMLGHRLVIEFVRDFEVHAIVRSEDPERNLQNGPLTGSLLHKGIDLRSDRSLVDLMSEIEPDFVINAAGLIKQKLSSPSDSDLAYMNATLPKRIGQLADSMGFRFINISTDCVFSGAKGQYVESDEPDCIDEYGLTKLRGEDCGDNAVILRTSIIGRELKGAYGLLEWFLSMKGERVRGFENAFFSGLTTNELSRVVSKVITGYKDLVGLYHVAGERISKADLLELANEIFENKSVIDRTSEPFIDRSLDSSRFNRTIDYTPPSWREMLTEIAKASETYERWRTQKF